MFIVRHDFTALTSMQILNFKSDSRVTFSGWKIGKNNPKSKRLYWDLIPWPKRVNILRGNWTPNDCFGANDLGSRKHLWKQSTKLYLDIFFRYLNF